MQISKIKNLLEPIVQELGFTLASVKYLTRGKEHYLEVVIDNFLTPISLDDIVRVSDAINPLLDDFDELSNKYILDVVSSGAEKEIPLNYLDKYIGGFITATLSELVSGTTKITGDLISKNDDEIVIKMNKKGKFTDVTIPLAKIKQINLAINFKKEQRK